MVHMPWRLGLALHWPSRLFEATHRVLCAVFFKNLSQLPARQPLGRRLLNSVLSETLTASALVEFQGPANPRVLNLRATQRVMPSCPTPLLP